MHRVMHRLREIWAVTRQAEFCTAICNLCPQGRSQASRVGGSEEEGVRDSAETR